MRSRFSPFLLSAALLAVCTVPALAAQGWLGVSTQTTDADLRRGLDLTRDGLLVNRVFADSPAERAGVKKGDVILRFDGKSVTEPEQLREAVREAGSGRSAKIEIWRLSASRTLDVKLAEVPETEQNYYDTPVPPAPPTPPSPPSMPAPDRSRAPELQRNAPPTPPSAPRGDRSTHRRVWVNGRELSDDEIEDKIKDLRIEGFGDWNMKELKKLKDLPDVRVWSDNNWNPSIYGGTRGR